jgi:hypothetical protein
VTVASPPEEVVLMPDRWSVRTTEMASGAPETVSLPPVGVPGRFATAWADTSPARASAAMLS